MKHRMTTEKRDVVARRALEICESQPTRNEGILAVEIEFDVSAPTARNLINRGRYLRDTPEEWH